MTQLCAVGNALGVVAYGRYYDGVVANRDIIYRVVSRAIGSTTDGSALDRDCGKGYMLLGVGIDNVARAFLSSDNDYQDTDALLAELEALRAMKAEKESKE